MITLPLSLIREDETAPNRFPVKPASHVLLCPQSKNRQLRHRHTLQGLHPTQGVRRSNGSFLIDDAEALRIALLSRLKPWGRPDVRKKLIPLVRKSMQATMVSEMSSQTHIRMQQAKHDEQHSEKGTGRLYCRSTFFVGKKFLAMNDFSQSNTPLASNSGRKALIMSLSISASHYSFRQR
jgi:hypothetical protein